SVERAQSEEILVSLIEIGRSDARFVHFCAAVRIASFDHLVGTSKYRWRYFDAKGTCSLQIDDKIKFGCLENWQVRRLDALENATGVNTDLAKHFGKTGRIAHQ